MHSGERRAFRAGLLPIQLPLEIGRDGRLLWHERQRIVGGDGLPGSPIGLDGQPLFRMLRVTGETSPSLREVCHNEPNPVRGDLTRLSGLLMARSGLID